MGATISINGKEYDAYGKTVADAARALGFVPDAFIFMVGEKPVPMDTPIADGVLIKAVKVASGG